MCEVAIGKRKLLKIYGKNWPTHDGTCIRDFIHNGFSRGSFGGS